MRTALASALLPLALLTGCGALGESTQDNLTQSAGSPFRLTMVDIGQGDGLVVRAPSGCTALIDAGPAGSGATIKAYLRSLGVTTIDFAIVSHFHADHLGGIDEVDSGTDAIPIGITYDRGGNYNTNEYNQYATRFAARRRLPTLGQVITLCGEVQFEVVALNGNGLSSTDENSLSLAVRVSYGPFDALAGGDLTGTNSSPSVDIESRIASGVGEVEVYKVDHHGSRFSSNNTLLGALLPTVSLISVGYDNTFGHPTPEAISRLQGVGSDIWQTEDPATSSKRGSIEITSLDGGNTYTVTQGGTSRGYGSKGVVTDTLPPTAPINLSAAARASQIDLAWDPSIDNVAVAGYRVYRDGLLLTSVTGTTYSDTGLTTGQSYTYTVFAYDPTGNTSGASNIASATTTSGGQVIINEILANEPGTSTAGEFIELVNVGTTSADIGGWTLSDAISTRHTFASGTTLRAGRAIVVYGNASAIPSGLNNAVASSTSTLALNNGGDTVTLRTGLGAVVDSFTYPASLGSQDGVSANRDPDASAQGTFVLHNTISRLTSSGGRRANGTSF
ncbi:MAG TPA: lamin tail domain-containing protein [Polyangia bacterium]|nr:lamin tail domain-containing protein [Polyangia bacterium]